MTCVRAAQGIWGANATPSHEPLRVKVSGFGVKGSGLSVEGSGFGLVRKKQSGVSGWWIGDRGSPSHKPYSKR